MRRRLLRAVSDGRQAQVRGARAGSRPGSRGDHQALWVTSPPPQTPLGPHAARGLSQPRPSCFPGVWTSLLKAFPLLRILRKFGAIETAGQSVRVGSVRPWASHRCRCPWRCVLSSRPAASTFLSTHPSALTARTTARHHLLQGALPDHPARSLLPLRPVLVCPQQAANASAAL